MGGKLCGEKLTLVLEGVGGDDTFSNALVTHRRRPEDQTVVASEHSKPGAAISDQFLNIVLDNTVEIVSPTEKNEIGMVVIRGDV